MTPPDRFAYVRGYAYQGPDTVIRRYFRPEKFLDLVSTGELHFAAASKMSDREEGFLTAADRRDREARLKRIGFGVRELDIARQAWHTVCANNAKSVVLSCWSMGPAEAPQMWDEYAPSPDAVAVETTVHALQRAFGSDFLPVPVQYMNRESQLTPDSTLDTLEPFFFKGKHYEWERELRFVGNMEMGRLLESPRRVRLQPSVAALSFVLSPTAAVDRLDEVRSLLEQWEPGLQVRHSSLRIV